MQISSGKLQNHYAVTMRSGRPCLINGSNGLNFVSDRWIALKILHEFPDAVFLGVATEYLLETRWSGQQTLSNGSKG
jgi:hypothetical protein